MMGARRDAVEQPPEETLFGDVGWAFPMTARASKRRERKRRKTVQDGGGRFRLFRLEWDVRCATPPLRSPQRIVSPPPTTRTSFCHTRPLLALGSRADGGIPGRDVASQHPTLSRRLRTARSTPTSLRSPCTSASARPKARRRPTSCPTTSCRPRRSDREVIVSRGRPSGAAVAVSCPTSRREECEAARVARVARIVSESSVAGVGAMARRGVGVPCASAEGVHAGGSHMPALRRDRPALVRGTQPPRDRPALGSWPKLSFGSSLASVPLRKATGRASPTRTANSSDQIYFRSTSSNPPTADTPGQGTAFS